MGITGNFAGRAGRCTDRFAVEFANVLHFVRKIISQRQTFSLDQIAVGHS